MSIFPRSLRIRRHLLPQANVPPKQLPILLHLRRKKQPQRDKRHLRLAKKRSQMRLRRKVVLHLKMKKTLKISHLHLQINRLHLRKSHLKNQRLQEDSLKIDLGEELILILSQTTYTLDPQSKHSRRLPSKKSKAVAVTTQRQKRKKGRHPRSKSSKKRRDSLINSSRNIANKRNLKNKLYSRRNCKPKDNSMSLRVL